MRPLTAAASCLIASQLFLTGCHDRKQESRQAPWLIAESSAETTKPRDEVIGHARVRRFSSSTWVDISLPGDYRMSGDPIAVNVGGWMLTERSYTPGLTGVLVSFTSRAKKPTFTRSPAVAVRFDGETHDFGRVKRGVYRRDRGEVIESFSLSMDYQLYKRIADSEDVTFTVNSIDLLVFGEQQEAMRDLCRVLEAEAPVY